MSFLDSLKIVQNETFWARSLIHVKERDAIADVIEFAGEVMRTEAEWYCEYHEARAGATYCRYGMQEGRGDLCRTTGVRIVPAEVWNDRS